MARSLDPVIADAPIEQMLRRRLAVVVLNHRTTDETLRAAASLRSSTRSPDEVIVVDNDIADDCRVHFAGPRTPSPESRVQSPEITYLHTGRNLGFSGGMNVGIRAALDAGAEIVLLANSDVIVSPDCLAQLEAALNHSGAGIVGPVVLSRTEPDRVASAGIRYNKTSGRMRELRTGSHASDVPPATHEVDAVSGCLMMTTRAVFSTVGMFDERYFYGFEDLDLCIRAGGAGFSTLLVGSAVAFHEGGRSIGRASPRRLYFGARNHLLVASRLRPGESVVTRALRLSWVAALNVAHAATADAGGLTARLAATFRGIRDHCGGRYGPDPAA